LGLASTELNAATPGGDKDRKAGTASFVSDNHHPAFLSLLSSELSVAPEDIQDFEM